MYPYTGNGVCSAKVASLRGWRFPAAFIGQCNGSQGVENVVKSRNHQRVATAQLATADAVEGRVIELIVGDVGSGIISDRLTSPARR